MGRLPTFHMCIINDFRGCMLEFYVTVFDGVLSSGITKAARRGQVNLYSRHLPWLVAGWTPV